MLNINTQNMKTTTLKNAKTGKKIGEYVTVNQRILAFRSLNQYKGYTLTTEIISMDANECIMKAIIKDNSGVVIATGIAHEVKGSTFINKTSHIENCETSAWGRALANLGIGIDGSIASFEEVENAVTRQEELSKANTPKEIPTPQNIETVASKKTLEEETQDIVSKSNIDYETAYNYAATIQQDAELKERKHDLMFTINKLTEKEPQKSWLKRKLQTKNVTTLFQLDLEELETIYQTIKESKQRKLAS